MVKHINKQRRSSKLLLELTIAVKIIIKKNSCTLFTINKVWEIFKYKS